MTDVRLMPPSQKIKTGPHYVRYSENQTTESRRHSDLAQCRRWSKELGSITVSMRTISYRALRSGGPGIIYSSLLAVSFFVPSTWSSSWITYPLPSSAIQSLYDSVPRSNSFFFTTTIIISATTLRHPSIACPRHLPKTQIPVTTPCVLYVTLVGNYSLHSGICATRSSP